MEELTEVESEVIDLDDIEESTKESCLVGKLVAEENWNPSDLIEAMKKAWEPKHGMSSSELGDSKMILFSFDDVMDRDWVLKHQPWHFNGYLFAIKKCRGNEPSSATVTIEYASYWARLCDVPISCMNELSLRLFAKQVGILESVDKSDEDSIGTFVRFKVSMNIAKPLVRGISIRVNRKNLWLRLKYESLPIYCFSCGTIGHDHKNCRRYNRNMKYSSCKLGASSLKRNNIEPDVQASLPHDVMENILSRLPVKYLLRFKVVSKQWEATISCPRFAEIHLQQNKNLYSQNILAWEGGYDYEGFHVAKFQNNYFKFVSVIEHSSEYSFKHGTLCNCDGLYLKYSKTRYEDKNHKTYVLWNPSCRAYKEFWCPKKIDDSKTDKTFYGICYNPLMKDYKVVIGDTKLYAVFSCRYNEWSEVKAMKDVFCGSRVKDGVSFEGSFYWLSLVERHREYELICFDWRDETFKKMTMPDCDGNVACINLNSSGGHLCLIYTNRCGSEMRIMKKAKGDEKDMWIEFKVQLPVSIFGFDHKYWVSEDEIIFESDNKFNDDMLYNYSKNTFVEIPESSSRIFYSDPVPYLENLFLP